MLNVLGILCEFEDAVTSNVYVVGFTTLIGSPLIAPVEVSSETLSGKDPEVKENVTEVPSGSVADNVVIGE